MTSSIIKKRATKDIRLFEYLKIRNQCSYYNGDNDNRINIARNHTPFLYQLNLLKKLPIHDGCVNTIVWNKTGEYILSGGDDCTLCITKPCYDKPSEYNVIHKVRTHHLGNIFSAKFLTPDILVSCSHQGPIIVHDLNSVDPTEGLFSFNCHSSTIYDVVPITNEDNKVFLSCSDDKTVRLFDLRCHKTCFRPSTCPHPALIRNSYPMTTISIHPTNSNLLLVGRADGIGLVYDRRKLPDPSKFSREQAHKDYLTGSKDNEQIKFLHPLEGVVSQFSVQDMKDKCRFTSLSFSLNGHQVLASYNQDYIYLFDVDRSTNFELVQTLPKIESQKSTTDKESESNQTNSERRRRIARIRFRGDWSDTGVDSVPATSDFNQTILRIRRTGDNGEIIAGIGVTAATTSNPINEHEEDNNEDMATADDDDDDFIEDDEEENDNHDHHDEHSQEHATEINVNEDNDNHDNLFIRGADNEFETTDQDERQSEKKKTKPSVSSKSRLLFSNTINNLKSKYGNIVTHKPCVKFQGHRNSRTSIKKAIFWGDDYIMSGSDCGRIMVWEKDTAKLVMCFPADRRVVNCLAPNPNDYTLASSGIDYDIKLWSTQNLVESPLKIDSKAIAEIVKNNEIMLEEARQTVTVPPHLFLFRVLATLSASRLR